MLNRLLTWATLTQPSFRHLIQNCIHIGWRFTVSANSRIELQEMSLYSKEKSSQPDLNVIYAHHKPTTNLTSHLILPWLPNFHNIHLTFLSKNLAHTYKTNNEITVIIVDWYLSLLEYYYYNSILLWLLVLLLKKRLNLWWCWKS